MDFSLMNSHEKLSAEVSLVAPNSPEEWKQYHTIRRQELFEMDGRVNPDYSENHPDDLKPQNLARVLKRDHEIIGTVRIDLQNDNTAILRLVAIKSSMQKKGLGKILIQLAERQAADLGKNVILINADPPVVDFYEKIGYRRSEWKDPTQADWFSDCIKMIKKM